MYTKKQWPMQRKKEHKKAMETGTGTGTETREEKMTFLCGSVTLMPSFQSARIQIPRTHRKKQSSWSFFSLVFLILKMGSASYWQNTAFISHYEFTHTTMLVSHCTQSYFQASRQADQVLCFGWCLDDWRMDNDGHASAVFWIENRKQKNRNVNTGKSFDFNSSTLRFGLVQGSCAESGYSWSSCYCGKWPPCQAQALLFLPTCKAPATQPLIR